MSKFMSKNISSQSQTLASPAKASENDFDLAYVRRVQEGDVAAYDNLVKKYRVSLISIIYNMTGNKEDASDLTQEVFIKAFQSIKSFQAKSSFFTWIYRIAINKTINFIKKSRKQRFINYETINENLIRSDIIEFLTSKNKTEKRVLIAELQEKLNDALQKLSPKHRMVVILYEVEGMSHKEISQIMRSSQGTVRSRLYYAKKELQKYLRGYIHYNHG